MMDAARGEVWQDRTGSKGARGEKCLLPQKALTAAIKYATPAPAPGFVLEKLQPPPLK